jgi:hypothetical protein
VDAVRERFAQGETIVYLRYCARDATEAAGVLADLKANLLRLPSDIECIVEIHSSELVILDLEHGCEYQIGLQLREYR